MDKNLLNNEDGFSYQEDLDLIVEVARHAGNLAMPYFHGDKQLDVQMKVGDSPVSAADYAVNAYLEEHLMAARPDYGWLSEETLDSDKSVRLAAKRTFIVDPIDGTRGFINGSKVWCVSVGIVEDGRPVAGVLVCPACDEIYTAVLGDGAKLNGEIIKIDAELPSQDSLIIGGARVFLDAMDIRTTAFYKRHPHVPSLAYRIAMVAAGKMAGTYIKPNAHDWDIAAADLILHEAGGVLLDAKGERFVLNQLSPKKPVMVACHPELLKTMLGIVVETPFS
ncbi:3'(2'),5'-bisphosphate nucleotidase CysQ [Ahrensia kielensis]|uniref:3'(2'),5'-bisphosphate nucleotidase CysQ n=1 Tax=Ahrensia kielensis TaxID=76980 RepID=UPI00037A1040|nr:3'(2'),5'-bisphosphate nucleotidase CysQ [Ahrensia kielensis]